MTKKTSVMIDNRASPGVMPFCSILASQETSPERTRPMTPATESVAIKAKKENLLVIE